MVFISSRLLNSNETDFCGRPHSLAGSCCLSEEQIGWKSLLVGTKIAGLTESTPDGKKGGLEGLLFPLWHDVVLKGSIRAPVYQVHKEVEVEIAYLSPF